MAESDNDDIIRFKAQTPRREKQLIYADEKVGKTTAWLEIAMHSSPDTNVYVIDTDDTFHASIEDFPTLQNEMDRFTVHEPYTWDEYRRKGAEMAMKCGPDDLIIIDRIEVARDAARDYHIEEIYGQGAAEWIIEVAERKASEGKKGPVDTEIPWSLINSTYYSWLNMFHRRAKGHVIWCAGAKPIIEEGQWADKAKAQSFYGSVSRKPAGGNEIGFIPHTILYLAKSKDGTRRITTLGDRGRKGKFLNAKPMEGDSGFFYTYMVPVAGWRPI